MPKYLDGLYQALGNPTRRAVVERLGRGPAAVGVLAVPFLSFTTIIEMKPGGRGALYKATLLHKDAAGRKQHEDMGFEKGWGIATDQVVALAKTLQ